MTRRRRDSLNSFCRPPASAAQSEFRDAVANPSDKGVAVWSRKSEVFIRIGITFRRRLNFWNQLIGIVSAQIEQQARLFAEPVAVGNILGNPHRRQIAPQPPANLFINRISLGILPPSPQSKYGRRRIRANRRRRPRKPERPPLVPPRGGGANCADSRLAVRQPAVAIEPIIATARTVATLHHDKVRRRRRPSASPASLNRIFFAHNKRYYKESYAVNSTSRNRR